MRNKSCIIWTEAGDVEVDFRYLSHCLPVSCLFYSNNLVTFMVNEGLFRTMYDFNALMKSPQNNIYMYYTSKTTVTVIPFGLTKVPWFFNQVTHKWCKVFGKFYLQRVIFFILFSVECRIASQGWRREVQEWKEGRWKVQNYSHSLEQIK